MFNGWASVVTFRHLSAQRNEPWPRDLLSLGVDKK